MKKKLTITEARLSAIKMEGDVDEILQSLPEDPHHICKFVESTLDKEEEEEQEFKGDAGVRSATAIEPPTFVTLEPSQMVKSEPSHMKSSEPGIVHGGTPASAIVSSATVTMTSVTATSARCITNVV